MLILWGEMESVVVNLDKTEGSLTT